jgi:hypothetical protein
MLDRPIASDVEEYLRANQGIDSAILAENLGVWYGCVEAWQRRLKLRAISTPGRGGT